MVKKYPVGTKLKCIFKFNTEIVLNKIYTITESTIYGNHYALLEDGKDLGWGTGTIENPIWFIPVPQTWEELLKWENV